MKEYLKLTNKQLQNKIASRRHCHNCPCWKPPVSRHLNASGSRLLQNILFLAPSLVIFNVIRLTCAIPENWLVRGGPSCIIAKSALIIVGPRARLAGIVARFALLLRLIVKLVPVAVPALFCWRNVSSVVRTRCEALLLK